MMWFSYVLCIWCFIFNVNAQTLGGFCKTPIGESAKCISVYQCDSLISLLRAPSRTPEQTQFLSSSKCGFNSAGVPYVCCGTGFNRVVSTSDGDLSDIGYTPNPSIPNRSQCGQESRHPFYIQTKIYGKLTCKSLLESFMWRHATGRYYTKLDIFNFTDTYLVASLPGAIYDQSLECNGVKINAFVERDVLTNRYTPPLNPAEYNRVNVRLGEYDTSSPGRDCVQLKGIQSCNDPEINAGIEEVIPHPSYTGDNNRLHDIALVRLDRDIRYTAYVQPICLPQPTDASNIGDILTVAGWGKTEYGKDSNVKLKLRIPVTDLRSCANVFSPLNVRIGSSQICAGGEDGKDSCTGDSGGPLMSILPTDKTRWMIEGLVSYGYNFCGTRGYPGVYTKVAKYVPWIHRTIKP